MPLLWFRIQVSGLTGFFFLKDCITAGNVSILFQFSPGVLLGLSIKLLL